MNKQIENLRITVVHIEDNDLDAKKTEAILKLYFPKITLHRLKSLPKSATQLFSLAPDLIILDRNLEDEDGLSVFENIPSLKGKVPVLVISSDESAEALDDIFFAGADDYLGKPIQDTSLVSKVGSLLTKKYVSPLAFHGRKDGIEKVELSTEVFINAINEDEIILASRVFIGARAEIKVDFQGLKIPVRVIENSCLQRNLYECRGAIASELMGLKDRALLRAKIAALAS